MKSTANENTTHRFGVFTVDTRAGELCRRGRKVKLQQQPLQVLVALVERAGEVVTREELRQKIWPADTFVDFEHSLNTAIKKLRQALGDRASKSKFVETLPKRGYRFLMPVELEDRKLVVMARTSGGLEGKLFVLAAQDGVECVLAPLDAKAFEEWQRLVRLDDDVGVSMMITDKRLLLLAAGQNVRMLGRDANTGLCEVRVLEGEHYGRKALVERKALKK